MISFLTNVEVADNSGAKIAQCIKILGGSRHKVGQIGDTIILTVKKIRLKKKIKKGEIKMGLVVRTKTRQRRFDFSSLSFSQNAVVLINNQGNPLGTRILGPVTKELRHKKWVKILTLAPTVV